MFKRILVTTFLVAFASLSVASASTVKFDESRVPHVRDTPATRLDLVGALHAKGRIHFRPDSYVLTASESEMLRQAAGVLRDHPNVVVYLVGHTDERGRNRPNRDLSLRRCHAVAATLERFGIGWERIVIFPAGESPPALGRHDEKVWARDRRVDVLFVRNGASLFGEPKA
jgi:outer membrane protein OmpA-like peptidoglycan-associated protein